MDEASQLKPEDAVGALAHGGQVVIVGDPKQLHISVKDIQRFDGLEHGSNRYTPLSSINAVRPGPGGRAFDHTVRIDDKLLCRTFVEVLISLQRRVQ
jgi:hypothetical protein